MDINTRTYDNLHYHEFLQVAASRAITSLATDTLICQAPLTEVHRLQHPFHMSRAARMAGRYQKSFITTCSPELARVQTTYGTTASSEWRYAVGDSLSLTKTFSKRLARKLAQVVANRSIFDNRKANDPQGLDVLKSSKVARDAFSALRASGVLDSSVTPETMPTRYIERAVCAGWFVGRL